MDYVEELVRIYSDRKFGDRLGFGAKPVLLVVDFIQAFTDASSPLGADFSAQLEFTKKILEEARRTGILRVFTTVAYEPGLRDAGLWRKKTPTGSLIIGTPPVEVDPSLERRPEEPIIIKKYASAFFGTHLLSLLNSDRVDTVIVAGCTTSGCVRATVVDGVSYGFRMIVVQEAVGDRAELTHRVSLADIDAKYGDVVSVSEVLEYLRHLSTAVSGKHF